MPKYSKGAGKKVERAMHEKKEGTLKRGKSGKKVKSRKQAIAIGLSEARKAGKKFQRKVPVPGQKLRGPNPSLPKISHNETHYRRQPIYSDPYFGDPFLRRVSVLAIHGFFIF